MSILKLAIEIPQVVKHFSHHLCTTLMQTDVIINNTFKQYNNTDVIYLKKAAKQYVALTLRSGLQNKFTLRSKLKYLKRWF